MSDMLLLVVNIQEDFIARKRQAKAYRTYDRFPFNSSPYRPAGLPRATASSRAVVRQHVQSGVALFPPRAGETAFFHCDSLSSTLLRTHLTDLRPVNSSCDPWTRR